jgi:hypothetical protein
MKSELDLFEVPPTQTSVAYGYWEQKGLTSALKDQGPYKFVVSGAGDDYIDLANTYPRSVPLLGLPTSGLFSLGRSL